MRALACWRQSDEFSSLFSWYSKPGWEFSAVRNEPHWTGGFTTGNPRTGTGMSTKATPSKTRESRTELIRSVSQFLARVESEKTSELRKGNEADFVFRGQRTDEPLIPRIARLHLKGDDLANSERLMLDEFERQMLFFVEKEPRDKWDLLAMAQHHRLPARLLDWTYSALTALWFCVEKGPARDNAGDMIDGVVWVFKTRVEDFITVDEGQSGTPFSQKKTRILRPRFVSRRIMAQAGLFTCHYLKADGEFVPLERNKNYKKRLLKVGIAAAAFSRIREQLNGAGVSSLSLFPDLEGLAEHLTERYFHDPHELQRPSLVRQAHIPVVDPKSLAQ